MGNIDSRSKFHGGYIYVKTDKPFYYSGNKVFGKIYIRVEPGNLLQARNLDIRVKGKEKCSYWEQEARTRQATRTNADGKTEHYTETYHEYV